MALPTLDATFASSADLPRKQMLAKWLVGELGETQAPSDVLVSGLDDYNGTILNSIYSYNGTFNGKSTYSKPSTNATPEEPLTDDVIWAGSSWDIIAQNGDTMFSSNEDVAYPWLVTSWTQNAGTGSPVVIESPAPSTLSNYYDLPERYLWAKIAVAAGGPKTEVDYISLPKNYVWSDIYNAVSGSIDPHTDWTENVALGHIAAAYRGDTGNPANLATYIDWPWRYKVASIIDSISVCSDNQANLLIDGNVLIKSAGTEPRFSYNLGSFTVSWYGGLWSYDDASVPITLSTTSSEELYPWLAGLGSKICP